MQVSLYTVCALGAVRRTAPSAHTALITFYILIKGAFVGRIILCFLSFI